MISFVQYSFVINLCFLMCSIPPLSVVGLSEEQAIEQANGDILIFTSTFNPMKNTVSGYVQHFEVISSLSSKDMLSLDLLHVLYKS